MSPLPSVRLAHVGPPDALASGLAPARPLAPALLVSYVYLQGFLAHRHRYTYRDWVMDSGAYSAETLGVHIELSAYIDCCHRLLAEDPTLSEIFALDVIGDWRAGLRNCEAMWKAGIKAIPCYHPGRAEPESVLVGLARDYPKIALGGLVGVHEKRKLAILSQCFARVWPCKIHGFGMSGEDMLMAFPFHSVDASSWEIAPTKFGTYKHFGKMSVRGGKINLRAEVEWYLALEQRVQQKWAPLFTQLGWQADQPVRLSMGVGAQYRLPAALAEPAALPTVRLATQSQAVRIPQAFGEVSPPSVRLAIAHTHAHPRILSAFADPESTPPEDV